MTMQIDRADYNKLKAALLDLGKADYENTRQDLIARLGYDQFRDLQTSVFKEIGTIDFEKHEALKSEFGWDKRQP